MKFARQKDFPSIILGSCGNITMAASGCFVLSIANQADMDPSEVNTLLASNKCFTQCNLLYNKALAAELCNLDYNGYSNSKPGYICIAETNDTSMDQHFFNYDPINNLKNDPLSDIEDWEENDYNIVSYRLFKVKELKDVLIVSDVKEDSVSDNLEDILLAAQDLFDISDKNDNQEGRVSSTNIGILVRSINDKLGL